MEGIFLVYMLTNGFKKHISMEEGIFVTGLLITAILTLLFFKRLTQGKRKNK